MSPTELVQLARELIADANPRGVTLRLFSGIAIYAHCDSIAEHPMLQREYFDVDFVAPRQAWNQVEALFTARGFVLKEKSAANFIFTRADVTAEVLEARLRLPSSGSPKLDLSARLNLDPLTASLSDLLLFKLGQHPFEERDRRDAMALLLDHRVVKEEDEETISHHYIAQVTSRNFPFWDIVMDNTIELEKNFDKYLEPEEAQLLWRRIELIQGEMDRHPKSLAWWSRAIFSRKLPWYH